MFDKIFSEREEGKLTAFEWTLIVGGLAILGVSVAPPSFFNFIQKLDEVLDVRQWSATTFGVLLSTVAFLGYAIYAAIQWFKERFDDEDDVSCARWLLILLALVCVETWLWRYASGTDFLRYAGFQIGEFFRRGKTTGASIGVVLGSLVVVALNLAVLARWIVLVLNRASR